MGATPGYHSHYKPEYLVEVAGQPFPEEVAYCTELLSGCSPPVLGFVKLITAYLVDACGPKRGAGTVRTALFGLQTPPLVKGAPTVLRVPESAAFDEVASLLMPFYITNARSQIEVSVHPESRAAAELAKFERLATVLENDGDFDRRLATLSPYNVLVASDEAMREPLLAMHWVSRLLPMGHVKSVLPNNDAFCAKFSRSAKWLAIAPVGGQKRALDA
eukprot:NODE_3165_length_820_cov_329.137255.p1 GENE.NODE_3165_length_820_cov_329.137255~~NODE_3165_length_820_cov_329.137255.p1  ORF type:complete len:218 (+),score=62.17 NODE_3165_length_820_cov_329.137255:3-656(+)